MSEDQIEPLQTVPFDQDTLNVLLDIKMSVVLTAGLYAGPLTKKMVADLVQDYLRSVDADIELLIDGWDIQQVMTDDGTVLVEQGKQ